MKELLKKLHEYRVELDKNATLISLMPPSRELSLARTRTEDSKMWLGQVLKRLDQENPYPDSKDATNIKIAPTQDVWDGTLESEFKEVKEHIRHVKILRQRFTSIYEEIEKLEVDKQYFSHEMPLLGYESLSYSWKYMIEANMWLGMELGRIKREEK